MANTNTANMPDEEIESVKTIRCRHYFNLITRMKESFGDGFDNLEFLNIDTGEPVKGSAFREDQTGCDMSQRFGGPIQCECEQLDEQIRFISEMNIPLSNIEYRLTLADGRTLKGKTNNEGKTNRIKSSNKPLTIKSAEFFVPDDLPRCPDNGCGPGKSEQDVKKIDINGIQTNPENLGSSFKTVVVKIKSRPLTAGEIDMAKQIFKESIDYSKVRVHNEEYLPFGLQDNNTAMTPNGEMYFNRGSYKDDFSTVMEPGDKTWFMHEMVHVWQYQLGYAVKWSGFKLAVTGGYAGESAYGYNSAESSKTLPDYNMEQQGEIIANYFAAKYLNDGLIASQLPFLENVLKEFLKEPRNAKLLPK
jgi:hypothetical protein